MEDLPAGAPAILATGTPEEIRQTAIEDARADVAARRMKIAFTGGFVSWPAGVPEKYFDIVESYPRVPLPTGCTSSWMQAAAIYAENYNKEILPSLIKEKNSGDHAKLSL